MPSVSRRRNARLADPTPAARVPSTTDCEIAGQSSASTLAGNNRTGSLYPATSLATSQVFDELIGQFASMPAVDLLRMTPITSCFSHSHAYQFSFPFSIYVVFIGFAVIN